MKLLTFRLLWLSLICNYSACPILNRPCKAILRSRKILILHYLYLRQLGLLLVLVAGLVISLNVLLVCPLLFMVCNALRLFSSVGFCLTPDLCVHCSFRRRGKQENNMIFAPLLSQKKGLGMRVPRNISKVVRIQVFI